LGEKIFVSFNEIFKKLSMKKLINYTILLSLSFVMFGCGGTTIDKDSDDYQYIEESEKGVTNYKGDPFTGTIVEYYYKDGPLETELDYKEGKMDGKYKTYYEDGQLELDGNFMTGIKSSRGVVHSVRDGNWKGYYDDGQLWWEANYKMGVKDGVEKYYYENGQLKSDENYTALKDEFFDAMRTD
jgi:antitoxin component YwqK of YwqJK toxin-antitoxin module